MATVRPVVWYHDTGKYEELRVGDTLAGAGAAADSDTFAFFMGG